MRTLCSFRDLELEQIDHFRAACWLVGSIALARIVRRYVAGCTAHVGEVSRTSDQMRIALSDFRQKAEEIPPKVENLS